MLWYSLEVPQWCTSNEYPQHKIMFSWRNKDKIYLIPLWYKATWEIRIFLEEWYLSTVKRLKPLCHTDNAVFTIFTEFSLPFAESSPTTKSVFDTQQLTSVLAYCLVPIHERSQPNKTIYVRHCVKDLLHLNAAWQLMSQYLNWPFQWAIPGENWVMPPIVKQQTVLDQRGTPKPLYKMLHFNP